MRPTGKMHLGHLHGALDNWRSLQKEYECFYFIADWHALTSDYETPDAIRTNIRHLLLDWLSVGLDPEKSTFFVQSDITNSNLGCRFFSSPKTHYILYTHGMRYFRGIINAPNILGIFAGDEK